MTFVLKCPDCGEELFITPRGRYYCPANGWEYHGDRIFTVTSLMWK